MFEGIGWLFIQWWALPWWAMTLWALYTIYFIFRSFYIWSETKRNFWEGYKELYLDSHDKTIRLYHILIIIIDLPPAIVGFFFPLLRAIFRVKIYKFKPEPQPVKKEES